MSMNALLVCFVILISWGNGGAQEWKRTPGEPDERTEAARVEWCCTWTINGPGVQAEGTESESAGVSIVGVTQDVDRFDSFVAGKVGVKAV